MRNLLTTCLLLASCCIARAQDFPGYRAGNYTGVNGVFFNPAHIADSRYRFDINLVSISTFVGNNQASFNLGTLSKGFNSDSLQQQIMGRNAGPSSGMVSVVINGPSVMFNTGKKSAFALTSRARTMANVMDMDGKLVGELSDNINSSTSFPYSISSNENMRLSTNSWTEFGASYASVLSDKGQHFWKGGATLKYLAGVANGYLNINNFKSTLEQNTIDGRVYMSNTTGTVGVGFGGGSSSGFNTGNFSGSQSTGFGGDLGFVYEFRPYYASYITDTATDTYQRDRNKYRFRVGLSVLDIGRIKYNRDVQRSGSYNLDITGTERLYLDELEQLDLDDYNAFFRARPQFFTPVTGSTDATYKVSLPSTLQVNIDYHVKRGFYMNMEGQVPLVNSKKTVHNPQYYSSFTLTPRYEGRAFGFYLPVNHHALTGFNAGASLRLGPLFIGSGSVLSALFGDSKQADVHVGLRFGGLQKDQLKKQKKAEKKKAAKDNKESESN
jgi:hypothetical protein